MVDFMKLNVDDLEFDCVYERFQDEIVHPETGEVLKQDFAESGHKVISQYPDIFLCEFSQGGGVYYALGKPSAPSPSTSFVLFLNDIRVPFQVTEGEKFAQDGVTRLWEVSVIGRKGVYCFSPFRSIKGLDRENVWVAKSMKFESEQEQNQIVSIIVKALSAYNHKLSGRTIRKDGEEMSELEHQARIKLLINDRSEHRKLYTFEPCMEKVGFAQVNFTKSLTSLLDKGSLIV